MLDEIRAALPESSSRGIADAVSHCIRSGHFEPGQQLPTIRTLAADLQVSPSTVSAAWSLLARAGLIHSDGRKGTLVSGRALGVTRHRRSLRYSADFEFNLSTTLPDQALLPDLSPALGRLRSVEPLITYLDQPIIPELMDHLHETWPCQVQAITIADGMMDALDLIVTTTLRFGDRVAVESVTDPSLLDLLEAAGAKIIPLELDEAGPSIASVQAAISQGVETLFIHSRSQHPTGISLSTERCEQLVAVLQGLDVMVVEVDPTGEISTIADTSLGSHLPDRTIHIRSYSASHGPELRVAAIGGPSPYVDQLVQRRHLGQGWTSRLLQMLLLDLVNDHEVRRSIDRARSVYKSRRETLLSVLTSRGVQASGPDGLLVWVPVAQESTALVNLASRGIGVAPGAPFSAALGHSPHICITAGHLATEHANLVGEAIVEAISPSGEPTRRRPSTA